MFFTFLWCCQGGPTWDTNQRLSQKNKPQTESSISFSISSHFLVAMHRGLFEWSFLHKPLSVFLCLSVCQIKFPCHTNPRFLSQTDVFSLHASRHVLPASPALIIVHSSSDDVCTMAAHDCARCCGMKRHTHACAYAYEYTYARLQRTGSSCSCSLCLPTDT